MMINQSIGDKSLEMVLDMLQTMGTHSHYGENIMLMKI